MTLQEIFDLMSSSELSQLSVGGQAAGVLNATNSPIVVPHINLALTTLYTRFSLKKGQVTLQPIADRTIYPLHSRYLVGNLRSQETDRFLTSDVVEVFKDNVLKVEQVLTDAGLAMPLNEEGNIYAVSTPVSTTLRLPEVIVDQGPDLPEEYKTTKLTVIYRASHPKLDLEADLDSNLIQLPPMYVMPLIYFVASRIHMPVGINSQNNAGDPYWVKYERACQELENHGMALERSSGVDRLRERGWA